MAAEFAARCTWSVDRAQSLQATGLTKAVRSRRSGLVTTTTSEVQPLFARTIRQIRHTAPADFHMLRMRAHIGAVVPAADTFFVSADSCGNPQCRIVYFDTLCIGRLRRRIGEVQARGDEEETQLVSYRHQARMPGRIGVPRHLCFERRPNIAGIAHAFEQLCRASA